MARKVLIGMVAIATLSFFVGLASAAEKAKTIDTPEIVKRGEYLVNYGGCNDCHTPKTYTDKGPQLDTNRLLSGHPADEKPAEAPALGMGPGKWMAATNSHLTAWVGPWGTSFAANLTPDTETGTGSWTPDMFIKIMRTGKHLGEGRMILPPMPWQDIGMLTDDDLKAVFAYLHSIKPVHNAVPDPVPPAASH
jgi:mono/diheme cytochrome c family protein